MKKVNKMLKVLCLFIFTFLVTGCVKTNTTMEIGKDKSMKLTMIEAIDTNIADGEAADQLFGMDSEHKTELEEKGFYIEQYEEAGKKGYKITKKFSNIDDVSSEGVFEAEEYNEVLTKKDPIIFTVKKGIFKNTYKAKYLNDPTSYKRVVDEDFDPSCEYSITEEGEEIKCGSTDITPEESKRQFEEYKEAYNSVIDDTESKFILKLPYKASKNNATSVDGKTYTWDLKKESTIEFEFPIYDMTRIYIAIGAGVLLLLFIIVTAAGRKPKKKNSNPKPADVQETKGFISQMNAGEETVNNQTESNTIDDSQQGNKFIESEEVVKEQPVESAPTINEVYNNIPVVGMVNQESAPQPVMPEPVPQPVIPEPVPQPVMPEPVSQPVMPEPVPQTVMPEPVPQPVMPEPVPQPVMPEPVPQPVMPEPVPQPVMPEPVPQPVMPEPAPQPAEVNIGIPAMINTPQQPTVIPDNNQ